MKFSYLFVLLSISFGCSSQKNTLKLSEAKSFSVSNCPTDGKCTLKLVPNQSFIYKTDTFGNGYGETIESQHILLKYSYRRNPLKGAVDGHYSETYYFNLTKSTEELNLKNDDLQTVGLVVDRQCFCKGTAGVFKITNGNLTLVIKKNELTLNGNFSHKKLPLVITKINEKVDLAQ